MPTINRLEKKDKSTYHSNTDMRELRRKAYSLTAWKKLRMQHIKEHPLCAVCERKGVIRPATQVHHIVSPFQGGRVNYERFLDPNNLESICPICHGLEHQKEKGYVSPTEMLKVLDEIMSEVEDGDTGDNNKTL